MLPNWHMVSSSLASTPPFHANVEPSLLPPFQITHVVSINIEFVKRMNGNDNEWVQRIILKQYISTKDRKSRMSSKVEMTLF
jgi:hypothetical protein